LEKRKPLGEEEEERAGDRNINHLDRHVYQLAATAWTGARSPHGQGAASPDSHGLLRGTPSPGGGWDGAGVPARGEVPQDPAGERGKGAEMPPARGALPAHRPVHAGDGAPGEAAGHGPVHLITQEVLPAPVAELKELVRVGGHAWGGVCTGRGAAASYLLPRRVPCSQGRLWKEYPLPRASQTPALSPQPPAAPPRGQAAAASDPVTPKGYWKTHRRVNSLR